MAELKDKQSEQQLNKPEEAGDARFDDGIRSIGIRSIKYKGLEVEFTGSIDVNTHIGKLEECFYTSLLTNITKSLTSSSTPVTLEAGNSSFVSQCGSGIAKFVNCTQATNWLLEPVQGQPDNVHLIKAPDSCNGMYWRYNDAKDSTPSNVTLDMNPRNISNDQHYWFVVGSTIAPYLEQEGYVTDDNPTDINNCFTSLSVSQDVSATGVVTVDYPYDYTCIPVYKATSSAVKTKPACPRKC